MTNPSKSKYQVQLTHLLLSFVTALLLSIAPSAIAAPGELDPTFGVGGKKIDAYGYTAYYVAIRPDGKIIFVGVAGGGFPVVTRYLSDGSLDPTFGEAGRAIIDLYGAAVDVAIQADGKILVAAMDGDDPFFGYLVRLTPNGSLDPSFGTNGILVFGDPSITAVQPDGKILITAISSVYRLNPDGSLDASFQQSCGPHITSLVYPFTRTEAVVQPDAKIVTWFLQQSSNGYFATQFGQAGDKPVPAAFAP